MNIHEGTGIITYEVETCPPDITIVIMTTVEGCISEFGCPDVIMSLLSVRTAGFPENFCQIVDRLDRRPNIRTPCPCH